METKWNVIQWNFWNSKNQQHSMKQDWNLAEDPDYIGAKDAITSSIDTLMNIKSENVFNIIENWIIVLENTPIKISISEHKKSGKSLEEFAKELFFKENNLIQGENTYEFVFIWKNNINWDLIKSNDNLRNKQ